MIVSEKELYKYLLKKGVSHNHAIGMINNIKAESNFNAAAEGDAMILDPSGTLKNKEKLVYQKNDGSWYYSKYHPTKAGEQVPSTLWGGITKKSGGLFQHYNDRFTKMKKYAGEDWKNNWQGQIDYALTENDTKKYLAQDFDNEQEASTWFTVKWERPQNATDSAKTRLVNIPTIIDNIGDDIDTKQTKSNVTVEEKNKNINVKKSLKGVNDWQGRGYYTNENTGEKGWYHIAVKWNEDKTDYKLVVKNDETGKILSEDSDIYKSARETVVQASLEGEGDWKKGEDGSGNEYYSSYGGAGNWQLADAPIPKNDVYAAFRKEEKKGSGEKFSKDLLDRESKREKYLKYLEENKDLINKIKNLKTKVDVLSPGTSAHTEASKRLNEAQALLKEKQVLGNDETVALMKELHNAELKNSVAAEKNARSELSKLENELKQYSDDETIPTELIQKIDKARNDVKRYGNRVKILVKQAEDYDAQNAASNTKESLLPGEQNYPNAWLQYDPSPVQKGHNANVINDDGTINVDASKEAKLTNILDSDNTNISEEDVTVVEKNDKTNANDKNDKVNGLQLNTLNALGKAGGSLLKGAGKLLDHIGGPGAIISYIMGKKGLKEAMKEVRPQASAKLSPMFMQHLRQSRELAKKGFHPDEARLMRKEIDNAYQIGLENAVRGSGGQRARFLAESGVLDAKRSSALLDYATKDAALQRQNADKHEKLMMFKENFDIQQTEKERAEDMERQVANKKAAAQFTSAAFTNLMSGFGGSSLLGRTNQGSGLFNQLQNFNNTGITSLEDLQNLINQEQE